MAAAIIFIFWVVLPPNSFGQDKLEVRFADAVAAWSAERYERAASLVAPIFDRRPGYFSREHGSVAFWLGSALDAMERFDEAGQVYQRGLHAMVDSGRFDVGLADAFVRITFARSLTERFEPAARAYLEMIRITAATGQPDGCVRIRPHLQALSWIMPPDAVAESGLKRALATNACGAVDAERIARWWRGQDPYPATPDNERLHEHLRRSAVALVRYSKDGEMDDRARIFVRLGPPAKQISIGFNSTEFRNKVIFRHMTLNAFDFPENEFWIYPHVDRSGHFLFVADRGRFALAQTHDLIPAELRHGLGPTERGIRKSEALIRTMEEILRELSALHEDYGMLYTDVADYAELLDQQEIASQAEAGSARPIDQFGADRMPVRTDMLPQLPHAFAGATISRAQADEAIAATRRDERLPIVYSSLGEVHRPLDVHVRSARFLDDDGSTRTEIYWALEPEALVPSRELVERLRERDVAHPWTYVVSAQARRYDAEYLPREARQDRISLLASEAGAPPAPRTLVVTGARGTYHVAAQWDQYVTAARDSLRRSGPMRVRVHVHRADTLSALSADEGTLEMSDLKPMAIAGAASDLVVAGTPTTGDAPPYPHASVTPETPLALYFEVYHLAFGSDDRTHYDVEYEVVRSAESPLLRLIGADAQERTSGRTTQSGSDRTARETILLDLTSWQGSGTLIITVRVTDRTTGAMVARSLPLRLAP